jgi:hypothetical protein
MLSTMYGKYSTNDALVPWPAADDAVSSWQLTVCAIFAEFSVLLALG